VTGTTEILASHNRKGSRTGRQGTARKRRATPSWLAENTACGAAMTRGLMTSL
jgi:hypothetical protein